ncbi:MAG: chromosomal replication initiator DnaA, partial [Albidovulum sp.]
LQACATATLNPPDDALLAAVLVKLFSDRQVAAPPSLITYLLGRIDRSFASANALVTAIDARALAEGRPVGRALAAEVLDSWAAPGP